jgi:5'-3' exonuclease
MGIEKFFNSLKKTYGDKIINKINDKQIFPDKYLLVDFNSIIHNISQNVTTSLIYLYHTLLVSNTYPHVFSINKNIIEKHLHVISTDESFIIDGDIILPDQSISSNTNTSDSSNKYNKSIDFKHLKLDDLDISFYRLLMVDDNMDKLIIFKVAHYVYNLTKNFPNLFELYLAIDGVPLYGKIIEQRKRRYIGYIIELAKKKLLEFYKNELNVEANVSETSDTNIYYNHYNFELDITKLRFSKSKISPATTFMTNLQEYIVSYLNSKKPKYIVNLDPYTNFGEGEKKIVFKIHTINNTNSISVYSPDADVILLMLIEIEKINNIQIIRYDQQLNQLDTINILALKNIILEYMNYKSDNYGAIKDIVMLFTILGNDFLPKLDIINTNRHIKKILDVYIKVNYDGNHYIFSELNKQANKYLINWSNFKHFLTLLYSFIKNDDIQFVPKNKEWKLEPNQIINNNAIPYYQHIFNIENISNTYDPSINMHADDTAQKSVFQKNNILINKATRKYIQGFIWLTDYYLNNNQDYKFFYYKYDVKPSIQQLIYNINLIINNKILNKLYSNLEKTKSDVYFKPDQQLIYITPYDVSNIIDKKYINKNMQKIIADYNQNYNEQINIDIRNNKINIYDYFKCDNAMYISKCELHNIKYIKPKHFIKLFN